MTSFISSFLKNRPNVQNLDAENFKEKLEKNENAVLLDVRTPQEYHDVRIPNSINLDLMDPYFIHEIEKLDKSKSYYIYCRSGNRSYYACMEMLKLGFTEVYNLADGIIGWNGELER